MCVTKIKIQATGAKIKTFFLKGLSNEETGGYLNYYILHIKD